MELIKKYFPDISIDQYNKFNELKKIYTNWNQLINVISRKDLDNFYERHVLHSLAIAKYITFYSNTKVLDVGTGGGFPGIPLAILFPNVKFTLIDSIGKKIKVVNAVKNELNLNNISPMHERANKVNGKYEFIISRAVTRLDKFIPWVKNKIETNNKHKISNGILYLKGGDISKELIDANIQNKATSTPISKYFIEEFFSTKLIVHIPLSEIK